MTTAQTDFLFTLALIVVVAVLAGLLGLVVLGQILERHGERPRPGETLWRLPQRSTEDEEARMTDATPPGPPRTTPPHAIYADLPDNYILIDAPLIKDPVTGMDLTLRRWLTTHHHLRRDVWADVVTNFYDRAALDHDIADYFAGVDMFELQRHFLAALMTVTGEGLNVGTVRRLHDRHRDVRNTRGVLITADIFDRTAGTLVTVIDEALRQTRPGDTAVVLNQVHRMTLVLREFLVYTPTQ